MMKLTGVVAGILLTIFHFSNVFGVKAMEDQNAMKIARSGTQLSSKGQAEYFTGEVEVLPLFNPNDPSRTSGARVTFQLGARSAWHNHPLGQILMVTSGSGWIQQWGQPRQEIHEGDVIWTPPGVKHWHGATATTSMTHIAIQEALNGSVVNWQEKVTDEQYLAKSKQ